MLARAHALLERSPYNGFRFEDLCLDR